MLIVFFVRYTIFKTSYTYEYVYVFGLNRFYVLEELLILFEKVCSRVCATVDPFEKLKWYGHISGSSALTKTILQGPAKRP